VVFVRLLHFVAAAAHHPYRASVASGDEGGWVYLVDLIGITVKKGVSS